MKVTITDECITCELCIQTCPEVFEMGEEIAAVKNVDITDDLVDAVQEAAKECPVEAIIVEE